MPDPPQPLAAPMVPLRQPPAPPAQPPRAPFAFPAPAARPRVPSKGGAGKLRFNGCCGQPASADAGGLACGKKRQEDCTFRGVVQTVEGLQRLTVPKAQPAGVWRTKAGLLKLKRTLRKLTPREVQEQFEVLRLPSRRPY